MICSLDIIIRILKTGLLTTAAQFFIFSGCRKGTTPCASGGYSFAVTSEFTLQQEIYNVGDTVYLTSIFPKTLTDQINNSIVVDYSNSVGIGGDIGIVAPDSILRTNKPAKDSFQFVSIIGSFSERSGNNQNAGINTNYSELSSSYQFKGGFICKKKGLYAFGVYNLLSPGLSGKNCTNAGFSMTVTNLDKHIQLYQNALGITLDPQAIKTIYCFRVQ